MQIDISTQTNQIEYLLSIAEPGEEVLFLNRGRVIRHLNVTKSYDTIKIRRKAGLLEGKQVDPRFFEPLDKDELELW